ncbi:MAG: hypothetical protein MK538_13375, partial [Planctomycetes bacterium]|nr:hypothetical protein [Planctomycetota bacterium]
MGSQCKVNFTRGNKDTYSAQLGFRSTIEKLLGQFPLDNNLTYPPEGKTWACPTPGDESNQIRPHRPL